MLTVTDNAAAHLAQLLAEAPEQNVVRFSPGENGLTMHLGQPQPGDTTFEHDEKTVLAFDAAVNEMLADKTLDLHATQQGQQLALH